MKLDRKTAAGWRKRTSDRAVWFKGRTAYREGLTTVWCPYDANTDDRELWLKGWREAESDPNYLPD